MAIKAEKNKDRQTKADLDGEAANRPTKVSKKKLKAMAEKASVKASRQPNRYDTGAMFDQLNPESGFNADSRYRDNRKNQKRLDAQFKKLEDKAEAGSGAAAGGAKKKGAKPARKAFKSKSRHKRR
jgi:hypothetical protein